MSGKLFSNKATKISAEKAPSIQEEIINKIHSVFPNIECIGLGSVGKKKQDDYNGDIDIGIKIDSIDELSNIIREVFDNELVISKTLYIVSMCYEYEKDMFVAVDFIQVKDIEYSKFRYYCPDYRNNESKYKVGTKIMLVGMLLNHCKEKDEGCPYGYYGKYCYDPTGLSRYVINRVSIRKYSKEEVTLDVNKIVHIPFNEKGTSDDFNSVESLWDAIHSDKFKYPEEVKAIELAFFVNCFRKGWEEQVDYHDFKIEYWTDKEIEEALDHQRMLREINMLLN